MFGFFKRKPSLDQVSTLLLLAGQVVRVVERPGDGAAKKAEAVGTVGDLAKSLGLPVPPALVDIAVEAAARGLHAR